MGRKRVAEREAISSWHLNTFDPGDKRKDFYDPPLCYRANSKGNGSFFFRYYVDGKRRRVTLGRHPGMTLNEARAAAFALKAEVDKGKDPAFKAIEMREAKAERSFTKFAKVYLDRRADQLRTGDELRRVFKVSIVPHFGPRCIDDIRPFCNFIYARTKLMFNSITNISELTILTHIKQSNAPMIEHDTLTSIHNSH